MREDVKKKQHNCAVNVEEQKTKRTIKDSSGREMCVITQQDQQQSNNS